MLVTNYLIDFTLGSFKFDTAIHTSLCHLALKNKFRMFAGFLYQHWMPTLPCGLTEHIPIFERRTEVYNFAEKVSQRS